MSADRWDGFGNSELRVILRGLRHVDAYWAPAASLANVKKNRHVRNQRDRMVGEIQGVLDYRAAERAQEVAS